ncbi:MAG: hypothetical protein ACW99U_21095, partial [Candidatus Thorarchaeota archaeon]
FRAGPPPGRVVYDWLLVLWHPGMPTIIVDNGFQVVLLGSIIGTTAIVVTIIIVKRRNRP